MADKRRRRLCESVSEALRRKEWSEAEKRLTELSGLGAKLGSLQRWVRDCDGARSYDEAASRRLVWLLCRVAAGQQTASVDEVVVARAQAWEPVPRGAPGRRCDEPEVTGFYVLHREAAAARQPPNRHDLRIWASRPGAVSLGASPIVRRVDVPGVPGAFVLTNVLSHSECDHLVQLTTALGYDADEPLDEDERAALELSKARTRGGFAALADSSDDEDEPVPAKKPKSFGERSKTVVWLAEDLNDALFARLQPHLPPVVDDCSDARGKPRGTGTLAGLNARWRCYRYDAGGTYRPHVDGAWPGSGVSASGKYVYDTFGDRLSKLTCLVYLNDDFDGGATAFYSADDAGVLAVQGVAPRAGSVLFFPHGDAQGSLVHEGSCVTKGGKFVIRTEVLYKWQTDDDALSSVDDARSSPVGGTTLAADSGSHRRRRKRKHLKATSSVGPLPPRPLPVGDAAAPDVIPLD